MSKKKHEAMRRYNETAIKYDARYSSIQKQKYREIFSLIDISRMDLILDIGSGTGLLLDFLSSSIENILCCDLSFKMLLEGKKRHPKAIFICADSDHLPFRKSSFNLTTCISVVQNLPEPFQTIKESFRILKEGGRLLLTALDKKYTDIGLRDMCSKAGYEINKLWHLSIEDFSVIAKKN